MEHGVIHVYYPEKRFGFIRLSGGYGRDVFFGRSQNNNIALVDIVPGRPVTFTVEKTAEGRQYATDLAVTDEQPSETGGCCLGRILRYGNRGFGFLDPGDGGKRDSLFFHVSRCRGSIDEEELQPGALVSYRHIATKHGPCAIDVELVKG